VEFYRQPFTEDEQRVLSRFFSNVDQPVFTLLNLPEVVKGALFARYSRSGKSLRRLFLDEFLKDADTGIEAIAERIEGDPLYSLRRAEQLYDRVFFEFGDDSVAQLGGAHIACEQASNVLTKALEWGRLASYLEQSTRYIYYDAKFGDRYRYMTPPEIESAGLAERHQATMDLLFDTYSKVVRTMTGVYAERFPRHQSDPLRVWKATIRAKACDTARGLLPASTLSNVGIFASGQAYEMALLRMQAHPLVEVREYGSMMLTELRKVIPSFLKRVDIDDRGVAWSRYLANTRDAVRSVAERIPDSVEDQPLVTLTDWDPDAELKLTAAALYPHTTLSDAQLLELARGMSEQERAEVIRALVGDRTNRRHRPGRAMERSTYRFDVLCDYGAFRDLQRHRMLTLDWQELTTTHGFDVPGDLGPDLTVDWNRAMEAAAMFYADVQAATSSTVAQYVVPFGYKIRFVMEMNAREAFHLIELRSQPAGHTGYRKVAQEMHRQIRDVAGHNLVANAMKFVSYADTDLERLESERRAEERRGT